MGGIIGIDNIRDLRECTFESYRHCTVIFHVFLVCPNRRIARTQKHGQYGDCEDCFDCLKIGNSRRTWHHNAFISWLLTKQWWGEQKLLKCSLYSCRRSDVRIRTIFSFQARNSSWTVPNIGLLHHCTSERHFSRSQFLVNVVPSSILPVEVSREILVVDNGPFIGLAGVAFYKMWKKMMSISTGRSNQRYRPNKNNTLLIHRICIIFFLMVMFKISFKSNIFQIWWAVHEYVFFFYFGIYALLIQWRFLSK